MSGPLSLAIISALLLSLRVPPLTVMIFTAIAYGLPWLPDWAKLAILGMLLVVIYLQTEKIDSNEQKA